MKFFLVICIAFLLAGCSDENIVQHKEPSVRYVDSAKAKEMMIAESMYYIVDVRQPEEYEAGHILNAVNVPLNNIEELAPSMLPDKNRLLLVYCRTGVRSRKAVPVFQRLGYTNIVDFGGIDKWTGPVAKGKE